MSLAENEGKGGRKPCSLLLLLLKDGGEELEPLPPSSLSLFVYFIPRKKERKKKFSVPLGKCKERREEEPLFRKLDLRGCLFLGLPAKQEAGLPPFLRVIYDMQHIKGLSCPSSLSVSFSPFSLVSLYTDFAAASCVYVRPPTALLLFSPFSHFLRSRRRQCLFWLV